MSHFFNEEYLLSWWLRHHRKHFDHGILINYTSTDKSVEVIRDLCPTWEVVDSQNEVFDAAACDREVKMHEERVEGWRITLNTTEFLYGNYASLSEYGPRTLILAPSLYFVSREFGETPDPERPLHEQVKSGVHYSSDRRMRNLRGLANYNAPFPNVGRHYEDWSFMAQDFAIFNYGFAPLNDRLIARKVQIQHRIPPSDKQCQKGFEHYRCSVSTDGEMRKEDLLKTWQDLYLPITRDLSEEVDKFVALSELDSVRS